MEIIDFVKMIIVRLIKGIGSIGNRYYFYFVFCCCEKERFFLFEGDMVKFFVVKIVLKRKYNINRIWKFCIWGM